MTNKTGNAGSELDTGCECVDHYNTAAVDALLEFCDGITAMQEPDDQRLFRTVKAVRASRGGK